MYSKVEAALDAVTVAQLGRSEWQQQLLCCYRRLRTSHYGGLRDEVVKRLKIISQFQVE